MFTLEVGCDDFYFGDCLSMKEYSYDYDAVTGEVSNESVKIYNTITELTDICYESSDESILSFESNGKIIAKKPGTVTCSTIYKGFTCGQAHIEVVEEGTLTTFRAKRYDQICQKAENVFSTCSKKLTDANMFDQLKSAKLLEYYLNGESYFGEDSGLVEESPYYDTICVCNPAIFRAHILAQKVISTIKSYQNPVTLKITSIKGKGYGKTFTIKLKNKITSRQLAALQALTCHSLSEIMGISKNKATLDLTLYGDWQKFHATASLKKGAKSITATMVNRRLQPETEFELQSSLLVKYSGKTTFRTN